MTLLSTPTDHPYHASASDLETFDGWDEYLETWADADKDYNLMVRFDVEQDEEGGGMKLTIFYVTQRRGGLVAAEILNIAPEDEPEVRAHLQAGLDYLMQVWAPLRPTGVL